MKQAQDGAAGATPAAQGRRNALKMFGRYVAVTAPAVTLSLDAAASIQVQKHKQVVTLTTPEWIDNDVYFLLEVTIVGANGNTTNILAAVVNYTLRV